MRAHEQRIMSNTSHTPLTMADSNGGRKSKRKGKRNINKSKKTRQEPIKSPIIPQPPPATETLEEVLFWYDGGSDQKSQVLAALKLEILGPFLFSRPLLCDNAVKYVQTNGLMPKDRLTWPMFFDKSNWSQVFGLSQMIAALEGLCKKEQHIYQSILHGPEQELDTSLRKKLKEHSPANRLKTIHDGQIKLFWDLIRIQAADYGLRTEKKKGLAVTFLQSLTEKVKLVDPVKDRGNTNFKQSRFKAAIADYSTAIKLCPFSPVLYCNRALCYLKNEDYWNACTDSFRAIVLHPTWEKPYYRCAQAWHQLGETSHAAEINRLGQLLCSSSSDLQSQISDFGLSESISTNSLVSEYDAAKRKNNVPSSSKPKATKTAAVKEQQSSKASSDKQEFKDFEELQYPTVDPRLSCSALRKLCNQIKLEWCSPASYFSTADGHSRWEEFEEKWEEPESPTTDPSSKREPMMAKFEEIWCPVLADVEESLTIIPPTVQYFSDGTIMHSAVF